MAELGCAETYQCWIADRKGFELVGVLSDPVEVRWTRVRDDISTAQVTVTTSQCCEILDKVECVVNTLQIIRDGDWVWEGPITRIEFGRDTTTLFAQDILWVASRSVMDLAYDYSYPNIQVAGIHMINLLRECYARYGDPWNMLGSTHYITGPDDAKTSKSAKAYSATVWEDIDKFAEDGGMDYTVMDKTIYLWDTNLRWRVLPDLTLDAIGGWPEIVQYGNELATRSIYTNATGLVKIKSPADPQWQALYGVIDMVTTSTAENDASEVYDTTTEVQFEQMALSELSQRVPTPMRIRLPAGTRLLPTAPWAMNDLMAGAWFLIRVDSAQMCRTVVEWHKLDTVAVSVTQKDGEVVAITSITAPAPVDPVPSP